MVLQTIFISQSFYQPDFYTVLYRVLTKNDRFQTYIDFYSSSFACKQFVMCSLYHIMHDIIVDLTPINTDNFLMSIYYTV